MTLRGVAEVDYLICFSQDVDFNSSSINRIIETSDIPRSAENGDVNCVLGRSDVEAIKEEIKESMYVVKLLGEFKRDPFLCY